MKNKEKIVRPSVRPVRRLARRLVRRLARERITKALDKKQTKNTCPPPFGFPVLYHFSNQYKKEVHKSTGLISPLIMF